MCKNVLYHDVRLQKSEGPEKTRSGAYSQGKTCSLGCTSRRPGSNFIRCLRRDGAATAAELISWCLRRSLAGLVLNPEFATRLLPRKPLRRRHAAWAASFGAAQLS